MRTRFTALVIAGVPYSSKVQAAGQAHADASKAAYVDVGLFDFASFQQLQVQVVTPHGQFRRDLRRPTRRILIKR